MARTYSEVVSNSIAGDLITGSSRKLTATTPLALLPQTSWWKLFIDQKYHKQASPWLLFDREKSKGFHAVMMSAFKTELSSQQWFIDKELDFACYERMHQAVTNGVSGLGEAVRSGLRPNDRVTVTTFPAIYRPSPVALNELFAEGIGLVAFPDNWGIPFERQDHEGKCKVILLADPRNPNGRFQVNYTLAEAPTLANRFFKRYYAEMKAAGNSPLAEVRAIVRLVRVLHVYHFFGDGNGRLNTMLLLNKLLLENCFPPSIIHDPAIFGGGFTVEQLVSDVHKGMVKMLAQMEAHQRLRHLI